MGSEIDGLGGLFQREAVGDQFAHVELAREDQAGDFALQGEIGGVAAEEVLLIDADGG